MNCFLAKIIYQIICGEGNHTPQFDEQLRIVEANNEFQAMQKARQIGEKDEISFLNERKKLVRWKFIGVSEINMLPDLVNGAELYSRICETDNADEYIEMIQDRSSQLLAEIIKKSFLEKTLYPMAEAVENCVGKIG